MGIVLLLLVVLAAIPPNYVKEASFLESINLGHLVDKFFEEEITMDFMARLRDSELKELGVFTMGARHRFRDALTALGPGANQQEEEPEFPEQPGDDEEPDQPEGNFEKHEELIFNSR